MMGRRFRICVFVVVLFSIVQAQLSVAQTHRANVVILASGGTIAGAGATATQAAYTSGAVTIDAMLDAVPGLKELANIKGEQISYAVFCLKKNNESENIVYTHGDVSTSNA